MSAPAVNVMVSVCGGTKLQHPNLLDAKSDWKFQNSAELECVRLHHSEFIACFL